MSDCGHLAFADLSLVRKARNRGPAGLQLCVCIKARPRQGRAGPPGSQAWQSQINIDCLLSHPCREPERLGWRGSLSGGPDGREVGGAEG